MEGSANNVLPFFVPRRGVASRVSAVESPTARWRRWRARSPPRRPQTAKLSLGVSLLVTFLFAPAVSKRKVAMEAETRRNSAQTL